MMAAYAQSGWKDVMLDLEHAPWAEADIVRASTALAHAGATAHLKMANRDPIACMRYLQFGIRHFLLPHVEAAAQVRAVSDQLASVFYVDPAAVHLYPMIESRVGISQIPAIAAERQVSAVVVGTIDLALDLGFKFANFAELTALGREIMPPLLDALDQVRAAGKPNGCMLLRPWLEFFPLDRADNVMIGVKEVLSPLPLIPA